MQMAQSDTIIVLYMVLSEAEYLKTTPLNNEL